MSVHAVTPAYSALLTKFPPRIIRSEEQNEAYLATLYGLEKKHESWGAEEAELAALLTLLIEDFESKEYALPNSGSGAVLRFLVDQHGLDAAGMGKLLGCADDASAVLDGKRELTVGEIRRLSECFHVSPEVFF